MGSELDFKPFPENKPDHNGPYVVIFQCDNGKTLFIDYWHDIDWVRYPIEVFKYKLNIVGFAPITVPTECQEEYF